ncbi:GNAT family N-acetyltransferase [Photobacterium sp. 1_MG-2023]|uniref:GNAT family N-acetyltransferase n=1 Tax=Photobacterium sp. 1_MG-2023 TaxID=3062646 RepID=UPI0034C6BB80
MPVLVGQKVTLPAFKASDAEALLAIYSDVKTMRYMSDALQQLIQYARGQKLKTLWAKVDRQNGRSIRLFLKFGFQPAASVAFYLFLD